MQVFDLRTELLRLRVSSLVHITGEFIRIDKSREPAFLDIFPRPLLRELRLMGVGAHNLGRTQFDVNSVSISPKNQLQQGSRFNCELLGNLRRQGKLVSFPKAY